MTSSKGPSATARLHRPGARPRRWWTGRSCQTGSGPCRTCCRSCGCLACRCSCGAARTGGRRLGARRAGASGLTDWPTASSPARSTSAAGWASCSTPPPTGSTSSATLVAFRIRDFIPWWLVALLIGRELLLGAAAGPAPATATRAAGALPGQGGDAFCCFTRSRCCCSPTGAARSARSPAVRLGLHHLGDGAVPAGRGLYVVQVAGSCGPSGRRPTAGTTP